MTTSRLLQWMREEGDRLEMLTARLHQQAAHVPRVERRDWLEEVRASFEHYRAHLIRHIALVRQGGYLASVMEHRPALSPIVDDLRREHDDILRLMEDMHQSLQRLEAQDELLLRDCCSRITFLLNEVNRHAERENDLVTSAFTQDIGGQD